jgi:hypothetical protein
MVAENEARAFARLVAAGQQGRLEVPIPAGPDPDSPVVVDGMADVPPIALDPIDIEPIVASAARQSEGERP